MLNEQQLSKISQLNNRKHRLLICYISWETYLVINIKLRGLIVNFKLCS